MAGQDDQMMTHHFVSDSRGGEVGVGACDHYHPSQGLVGPNHQYMSHVMWMNQRLFMLDEQCRAKPKGSKCLLSK